MRLIDADRLNDLAYFTEQPTYDAPYGGDYVVKMKDIDDATTINPEDLRPKGKWVYDIENDTWHCSECGEENCYAYSKELKRFTDNYCPVCGSDNRDTGAKMEE